MVRPALIFVSTLFFSLSTACALHAGDLHTAVRQVDARDFTGTFSGLLKTSQCATKLKHDGLIAGGNAVAHQNITVNGVRCRANGRMNLFPVSNADRVSAAIGNFNGPSKVLAETVVDSARKLPGSYIGTSNAPRICGGITYKAGTMWVFVKANQTFPTVSGWPDLPARQRNMVSIQPGQNFVCPSSAKLRESPTPAPGAFRPQAPAVNGTAANTNGTVTVTTENGTVPVNTVPEASADPVIAASGTTPVDNTDPAIGGIGDGPAPSPAPDGSVCFPADATVELRDGSKKAMDTLQIGDSVRVSTGKYSPVFMFTHKLSAVQYSFVQITTATGERVALTAGHYLQVNGRMAPASSVKLGDTLSTSRVTEIKSVVKNGLYNPQTIEGSIVVDGVVASTYTTTVEPTTAHTMLAPLRAAFGHFGLSFDFLDGGADAIASVLPSGNAAY